jgi:ParB-like chromosome segregation protein Spo0J
MLIKEITLNKQTQSRESISEETVAEYAESMLDGQKFPPMTVFFDGIEHYLVDGYHRYFACKKAGIEDFEVKVINGTLRDAVLYATGVNDDHGLRRTNGDKRKAVMTLFNDLEWAEWSDGAIARKCKVSTTFVGRVRKSLELERTEKKYINKHGQEKTINTEKISAPKAAPVVQPEVPQEDEHLQELAHANIELAEELAVLKDRLALKVSDIPEEEKHDIEATILELRATIKAQEAEIAALKSSRDQLLAKNADMLKQLAYWKKQATKAAA